MSEYDRMQQGLARGWNTWNTRSVLSHVLLPEGFALNLGLREYRWRRNLREALIKRVGQGEERVIPGPHAYDGSYTELTLEWLGNKVLFQSATADENLVILVTPLEKHPEVRRAPLLVVESGVLWNRSGFLAVEDGALVGNFAGRVVRVFATTIMTPDPHIPALTPYLSLSLDGPVGLSTGSPRTLDQIQSIIVERRETFLRHFDAYGEMAEVYKAIQTAMAWDTIYEPEHNRVVSPVSRNWNVHWGGFVLFDWDNYFAAYLAAAECKEIAYANAVEMTRAITETGLVPNFATSNGVASRDRSEPPVGALMCRELYRKFRETWFLEEVYPDLLRWNRWWHEHRRKDGLLCWGSDPYEPVLGSALETEDVHNRFASALESGLDNSPMYDDVAYDAESHLMLLHDVGLNGMYIADCEALADIASALERGEEEAELRSRAEAYRSALQGLWDETAGIFLNRHVDTGEFSRRLSPTLFYALLGRAATQAQAERMMREHFYNPDEFWGEWILPTIARNDPGYPDQHYWRGRIWGPMNFLVYLGLRRYDLPQARADLAEKSVRLLLKEWLENGHIHENYNANTGEGCDIHSSDAFYHWGALLGAIAMIESGHLPPAGQPL